MNARYMLYRGEGYVSIRADTQTGDANFWTGLSITTGFRSGLPISTDDDRLIIFRPKPGQPKAPFS